MTRLLVVLVLLGLAAPAAAETLPFAGVVDICHDVLTPNKVSNSSGSWATGATWVGGVAPTTGDVVEIAAGHVITGNMSSSNKLACLGVHGTLNMSAGFAVTVTTTIIYPGGVYTQGTSGAPLTSGTFTIGNTAIDTTNDPEQYGTGFLCFGTCTTYGEVKTPFCRLTTAPVATTTTVTCDSTPTNWDIGDRVVLPESGHAFPWVAGHFDARTIDTIAGAVITLDAPLTSTHPGGVNGAGVTEFTPHLMNLTRTTTFQSEDPDGVRGHVIAFHMAVVDMQNTGFLGLGRTLRTPLDCTGRTTGYTAPGCSTALMGTGPVTHTGTNQIGRYPLHLHHVHGDAPLANGYQFTIKGNAVDNGDDDFGTDGVDTPKWGIAIHDAAYGLVEDNVTYNTGGGGLVAEDGAETHTLFHHNMAARVPGGAEGARGDERMDSSHSTDFAFEGSCFWSRGPLAGWTDNVGAGCMTYGMKIFMYRADASVNIPDFQGADPSVDGTSSKLQEFPLWINEGNEIYGSGYGYTVWHLCSYEYDPVPGCGASTFQDMHAWNVDTYTIFWYSCSECAMDGAIFLGNTDTLTLDAESGSGARGIEAADYHMNNFTVSNSRIENFSLGMLAPMQTEGEQTFTHVTWKNVIDVNFQPVGAPGALPGGPFNPRIVNFTDNTFANTTASIGSNTRRWVYMQLYLAGGYDRRVSDTITVTNANSDADDDFYVYFLEAGADEEFAVTQNFNNYGCPEADMTNAECLAAHGVATMGALPLCEETRSDIRGLVCPFDGVLPPSETTRLRLSPSGLILLGPTGQIRTGVLH